MAKRGRPKGSTYPDGPYLDRIADALTRTPEKSANSVIMAIAGELGISDYRQQEAFRRRLHEKWSVQKEDRMTEARERHAERNRPPQRVVKRNLSTDVLRTIEESPAVKVARMYEDLPHFRLQKLYDDLPHVRLQKMYDDLPHVRIQKMLDDMPAMRIQKMLDKLNL